ncbi:hypothetical protein [Mesorhizobium sp.]|uniref:hypothetical protein n=1 Tax=Mesorhizobium sp. TaxID=1871066 RepID=UPI000FE492FD|nr:hypothetical protein [Mesorhizobium sp.]RWK61609.1 MAG: hypothetical protein EOR54_33085 [Mesorhizobium sp.]RWK90477.1 MAG: hypothetical protein EOR53_30600 [Mesorhizobium sp.]
MPKAPDKFVALDQKRRLWRLAFGLLFAVLLIPIRGSTVNSRQSGFRLGEQLPKNAPLYFVARFLKSMFVKLDVLFNDEAFHNPPNGVEAFMENVKLPMMFRRQSCVAPSVSSS